MVTTPQTSLTDKPAPPVTVAVTQPDGSVKQVPAKPETVSQGLDALLTELEKEMKNGDPATIKNATRLWLIGSAAAGKGDEPDGAYVVAPASSASVKPPLGHA
jgi:hypothetical protein